MNTTEEKAPELNVEEGLIYRCGGEADMTVAAGSRTALLNDGRVVCTFMVQTKLGSNDFKPMICDSVDEGRTWQNHRLIWPALKSKYSIFGSVSRSPEGDLYFFGSRTPIEQPGESFWSDETQGIKQNQLIWSRSSDGGDNWSELNVIPMPIAGSAEAAGPMCITRSGRLVCCYCPYNTFDADLVVDRNQVVVLTSNDHGKSWFHTSMLRFEKSDSGSAESWVIELSDNRLFGICWHVNHETGGDDLPNAYSLSNDEGATWSPTQSTGIMGQATALAALPNRRALFAYNDRKHQPPGVWVAEVEPTADSLNVVSKRLVWSADHATQTDSGGHHTEWTDFAFGEPSVTVLPDQSLLLSVWNVHSEGKDIRYVRFRW